MSISGSRITLKDFGILQESEGSLIGGTQSVSLDNLTGAGKSM